MSYEPTVWVNNQTPVNATNLNKIEGGLKGAADVADDALSVAQNALEAIQTLSLDTTPGNDGEDGQDGEDGAPGKSVKLRGQWQPNTAYEPLDLFAHEGTLYGVQTPYTSGSTWSEAAELASGATVLVTGGSGSGSSGGNATADQLSIGTVESGSAASATITGTSPNKKLNLVLVDGQPGKDGDQGTSGYELEIGDVVVGDEPAATLTDNGAGGHYLNLVMPSSAPVGAPDMSALWAWQVFSESDRALAEINALRSRAGWDYSTVTQLGEKVYGQVGKYIGYNLVQIFQLGNADYGQPVSATYLTSLYGNNSDALPDGINFTAGALSGMPTQDTLSGFGTKRASRFAVRLDYTKTDGTAGSITGWVSLYILPAS